MMSKTYLKVPYEEKDEAKALGARWDPAKKSWFAPDGVDLARFSRWLDAAEQDAYLYIVVRNRTCWKCGAETSVVALGIPYGEPFELDEDDLADGAYPAYDPERYDALALVPRLGAMPRELRDHLEQQYNYRLKRSKTTGSAQLNNTCDHCGALQGEFFDFGEPSGAFVLLSEKEFQSLKFYRVRTSGMVYGLVDRWSSLDEALFQYAKTHCEDLDLGMFENIYLP